MKKLWKILLAVGSAIIAVLLLMLNSTKPRKSELAEAVIENDDKLEEETQTIIDKTDDQIIEEIAPAKKEEIAGIVEQQVDKAMESAQKYRRKKTP